MQFKPIACQDLQGNALSGASIDIILMSDGSRPVLYDPDGNNLGNPATAGINGIAVIGAPDGLYMITITSADSTLSYTVKDQSWFDGAASLQTYVDECEAAATRAESAASQSTAVTGAFAILPNAAATTAPVGFLGATISSAGSGGTNGTYPLKFSGGSGSGAAGYYTVAGGALTSLVRTSFGSGYGTPPTFDWSAASFGTPPSATALTGTVPDGTTYFAVSADGSTMSLYVVTSGAPALTSPVITVPASQFLTFIADGVSQVVLTDGSGFAYIGFTSSDIIINPGYLATKANAIAGAAAATAISLASDNSPEVGIGVDPNGFHLMRVNKTAVIHPYIQSTQRVAERARRVTRESNRATLTAAATFARLAHMIILGQSLSIAYAAMPIIDMFPFMPYSKMFAGGLRSRNGDSSPSTFYASLVNHFEASDGSTPFYGETYAYGAMMEIAHLLLVEDNIDISQLGVNFLWSCPGEGSQSAAQIAEGGGVVFPRVKLDISNGLALAPGTYLPQFVLWSQGNQDEALRTSASSWKTTVIGIQTSIQNWINTYCGVNRPIPFILTQDCAHRIHTTTPDIPMAQLDLAENTANFYLSNVQYIHDYTSGEHLTSLSSRAEGAYFGRAIKRMMFDQVPQRHLRIGQEQWFPKAVILPIQDHIGEIKFRTDRVTDPGNYGFTLVDSGGSPLTINTPQLCGRGVEITSPNTIPSGAQIRYAWGMDLGSTAIGRTTGPRGNLTDSAGDLDIFDPGGQNYRLDNYCPIFARTKP